MGLPFLNSVYSVADSSVVVVDESTVKGTEGPGSAFSV